MDIKSAVKILDVNKIINRNQVGFCEAADLAANVLERQIPQPIEDWSDDDGDCLWWKFPIEESPYCGSPLDLEWREKNYDGYYTHFTRLTVPQLN